MSNDDKTASGAVDEAARGEVAYVWTLRTHSLPTPWGQMAEGVPFWPSPQWLARRKQKRLIRDKRLMTLEQWKAHKQRHPEGYTDAEA